MSTVLHISDANHNRNLSHTQCCLRFAGLSKINRALKSETKVDSIL